MSTLECSQDTQQPLSSHSKIVSDLHVPCNIATFILMDN